MTPRGCHGLLSGAVVLACALAFVVPARADFATVTKTFPGGTVSTALLAGNPVVYEIKVVTGTASANVVVEDRLPTDGFGNQQVSFISSDCDSSDPLAPVPPCLGGHATQTAPGVLRWVFPGTTGPGETLTMHLNVRLNDNLDDGTLVRNAVTATDSTGASVTSGFATVTVRAAKLTVTKTAATGAGPLADGAPLFAGDLITYTLAVTNTGVADANGVVIHDLLPVDEIFVMGSATPAGFPDLCVVCGLFSDGIVEWQYEVLQPGQTVTLTFDAQVDA
ncbi:MAG: hypothetical protein ACE5I7_20385, partial [Candidatus Binatia bacterium]